MRFSVRNTRLRAATVFMRESRASGKARELGVTTCTVSQASARDNHTAVVAKTQKFVASREIHPTTAAAIEGPSCALTYHAISISYSTHFGNIGRPRNTRA